MSFFPSVRIFERIVCLQVNSHERCVVPGLGLRRRKSQRGYSYSLSLEHKYVQKCVIGTEIQVLTNAP